MPAPHRPPHGRKQDRKLTRADYEALDEDTRKIVDCVRRRLAETLAANAGPVDDLLDAVTILHEAGFLTMVADERGVGLYPCLGGRS